MRDDDERQVQPLCSGFALRESGKSVRANRRDRNAAAFQDHTVVETPRRAAASIGYTVDDDVTLSGKFVEILGHQPNPALATPDHLGDSEPLAQALLNVIE